MPTKSRGTWTDEQCELAVRAWHAESTRDGLPLNHTGYAAWRARPMNSQRPPANAIAVNAATFKAVCEELGLEATHYQRHEHKRSTRRFLRIERIESIQTCANALGAPISFSDYTTWYSLHPDKDKIPSDALFRKTASFDHDRELAGLSQKQFNSGEGTARRFTDIELANDMRQVLTQTAGRRPMIRDWNDYRNNTQHRVISYQNLIHRTGMTWTGTWDHYIETGQVP